MEKKVGIIGAGISGLLACKYTLSKGYAPVVFESRSGAGGVWIETLETTKLQTPKAHFQFSDFPWPSSVKGDWPDHSQVLDYIESYARHFNLLKHIRFNTKVVGIEFEGAVEEELHAWELWGGNGEPFGPEGKWRITVEDTQTLSTEVYLVDFVILCIGRFCDVPNIPAFPTGKGPEVFEGKVIHSMDYSAMDFQTAAQFIKGKRIIVVGNMKSGMDIAMEAATANGVEYPCKVLYKTKHWSLPDYAPWGIPLTYLYFNRFSELLIHKPGEGLLLSLLATILSPLRWVFSKIVESYIKRKLSLDKFGMVPEHSFFKEISSCFITIMPKGFYDRVEKGSIILKKASGFSFCKEGIIVDGESAVMETDLVILATGFKGDQKLKDMFVSPAFKDCIFGSSNASIPLYRQCIHPRIPQLAVIGFSESISNIHTSEMRCWWLAELLDGTFKLPSIKEMEKEGERWDKYMKRYSKEHYRRSCISILHIWYNDKLCEDIGVNPKRKKGFFAELFQPYGPLDYNVS